MAEPKFKLKNYSTEVSADRSIAEIEKMLACFGASQVMKEYLSDGSCRGVAFRLNEQVFKLPANVEGVRNYLFKLKSHGIDGEKKHDERAGRVAWRILKDWLAAQLSIVASGQAQPDEVLLPYLWNGKQTLYSAFKKGQLQLKEPEQKLNGLDNSKEVKANEDEEN